jgi:ubiquitin carboxyl-terminal hydrolase 16
MPDKPTTVAAYAAGASLAAITLFYVFGPNFTIDGGDAGSGHKKGAVVGLANPANDCFINSVLQTLAGLGELRLYLIRELHRRGIDGPEIYSTLPDSRDIPRGQTPERIRELQEGTVTLALKEMLDRLNERPIYKKTITARAFIQALERAFRTRLSRNQQDAQEFLQLVAERLCDECHAAKKARRRARALPASNSPVESRREALGATSITGTASLNGEIPIRIDDGTENGLPALIETKLKAIDDEQGFPFEGQLESQIECQFCHFQYQPNKTTFVNLTLQVPQKSSTTLSSCFDGLLKTEYIEDFRCDKCRLLHALETKTIQKSKANSEKEVKKLEIEIRFIKEALENDPEKAPESANLPPSELAPKRRIARHMRITVFPKIIAIHLSRSIFSRSSSTKNAAKVSFPERLPLGGILNQRWYKLLGIVCHKGNHNSGHYESFRRNHLYAPFSTPDAFRAYAQSRSASETPSLAGSPQISASKKAVEVEPTPLSISRATTPSLDSSASFAHASPPSSRSNEPASPGSLPSNPTRPPSSRGPYRLSLAASGSSASLPTGIPVESTQNGRYIPSPTRGSSSPISENSGRTAMEHAVSAIPKSRSNASMRITMNPSPSSSSLPIGRVSLDTSRQSPASRLLRRRKQNDRWWRISDDKVKECRTSDVLGMQKEVYLLFYEMERDPAEEIYGFGRPMSPSPAAPDGGLEVSGN